MKGMRNCTASSIGGGERGTMIVRAIFVITALVAASGAAALEVEGVRLADKELRVFEHTKAGKHKG